MTAGERCALPCRTPNIDTGEQEQPNHVDKVPVPGGELESEMLGRSEMAEIGANQADDQECRADDHMRAVKSGGHEKGGAIDVAAEIESGVAVLVSLNAGESETERDGEDKTPFESLAVVLQERVVRPSHGSARGQQDERIQERQM